MTLLVRLLGAVVALGLVLLAVGLIADEHRASSATENAAVVALVPRDGKPTTEGPAFERPAKLEAAPGAISVVPDPLGGDDKVFRFTVDEGDVYPVTPTEDPRAQALLPSTIDPGEELWLRMSIMVPDDFPSLPGWMTLAQVYGPPFDGPSPWQLGIRGDQLMWQRNGTYGYDIPWQMRLPRRRWVEVLMHQRFAPDGWVEMWIDGERVTFFDAGSFNPNGAPATQRLEMATVDSSNGEGPNHAKIMQYREAGMLDSATVFFGALKVGATRAAVE